MLFHENEFYHIYNRGNNRQPIFFNEENYLFFLRKIRIGIKPFCEIVAYCLMPNHFHLLIYVKGKIPVKTITMETTFDRSILARKIGTLQSSYAQAINNQQNSKGSLFQQKAKAKLLNNRDQPFICFNYIHQNPLTAGLVHDMADWEFSSYKDYAGLRNGTLTNKNIAYQYIDLPEKSEEFVNMSKQVMSRDKIKKIF